MWQCELFVPKCKKRTIMPIIYLHRSKKIETISYEVGNSLMQIFQGQNISISAPCGGNGTCGKCRVKIKNIGFVNSCLYYPDTDIEVSLPNEIEEKVLTNQNQYIVRIPVKPNALAMEQGYPISLAMDIGTTSIVFYWISLITGGILRTRGISNPQAKFGADVISRIQFCSSQAGLDQMQKELVDAINKEIEIFTTTEGVAIENIVKLSVSANTTMLHLLAGIDPTPIALAPFVPNFTEEKRIPASELNIQANPNAIVHLMPSISAYVGADIVSGLASLNPPKEVKTYLFIDIGTNGEMAIVTPEKIYACTTAAGPAFEGANISCGMGAFDGAISVFTGDEYQTIANEKPIGVCGSGLLDIVAYLLNTNVILSDGELKEDFVLAAENESGTGEKVVITPQDIREIQLAKSAIITGVKIILQTANVSVEDLDAVYIAGGLGNYMNPESAVTVGLLPEAVLGKIVMLGNTSGTGAVLHALSDDFTTYTNSILEKTEHIELADHPEFEMEFAMNMFF